MSGEPREKHTLFLLGGAEARLQGVDALLEGGDAGRELPGVGRHVFTVALHADPAALCLMQCETEILQPAMLLPQARVEGVVHTKLQYPLDQRQSHAQVRVLGCVGSRGERRLHTLHARPLLALERGAERGHVVLRLDGAQLICQRDVALLQLADRARGEQRIRPWQPLGVGVFARLDHVLKGAHAVAPALQRAVQIHEVAVVLQSLLEIVPGQHRVQIARLGRIGQALQLPEPAVAGARIGAQHALEQVALLDARDGLIQLPVFGIEGLDRALVVLGGLRVGVQLAERVRHGEVGLLHGRVQHVAPAQLHPRRERSLVVPEGRIRPADAQQRLVRVRTVQAHARERRSRARRLVGLQVRKAEREIGAVPERRLLRSCGEHGPDSAKERVGIVEPSVTHQRHAQVEARVGGPDQRATPARQQADGLIVTSLVHQHVAEQQFLLRLQLRGHAPVHLAQCRIRALEIAARVPHLRQVEPGAIAHSGGHIVGQQPLEALARFVVHPERQVQPALEQLRFLRMVRHAAPVLVSEQSREGREVIVLIEVEQRVAVVQITDMRDRELLRVVLPRARRAGRQRQHGGEQQRTHAGGSHQGLFPVLDLELRL